MQDRITGWRITQARYAGDAFSGEGARRYGGRWNSRGTAVAYTAGSQSLALLEILAHLDAARLLGRYVLVPVRFSPEHVETLASEVLPADWRAHPAPTSARTIGDAWVEEARSPVLRVPSVLVPAEPNYLVNPHHPDFEALEIGDVEALNVDPRLLGQSA